jgi:hypothetical protein
MRNERAFSHCMAEALWPNSATLGCVCAFNSGCLAVFQAAPLGSGRQSAIERPTITATSRIVTGQRRGKCHRKKRRFRVCSECSVCGMFWVMSANEVLEQVKALPPRERRKFFAHVHDLETASQAPSNGKQKRRIRWPDAAARRRRIFGDKVLPNLVLLARELELY